MGEVFILSKKLRGKWADYKTVKEYIKENNIGNGTFELVDVTSASKKYRDYFSPMILPYPGMSCFENYWQSGKVYQDVDREKQLEWWKKQTKGKRKYPNGKDKKILYAQWDNDKKYGYIESRKEIYVPKFYDLIKDSEMLKTIKQKIEKGVNIGIVDFDGPYDEDRNPEIYKVELDLIKQKINDPKYPFGHGYIIAALLKDIIPSDYC